MMQLTVSTRNFSENEVELLIQNGKIEKLFGDSRIDPNYVFPNSGNSILHLSVKYDTPNLTKALVRLGCNVNIQNRLGNTALMDAVIQKRLFHVQLLLKANSDIHIVNAEGNSGLQLSLKSLNDATKLAIMKCFIEQVRSITTNSEETFKMLTKVNCSLTCAVILNDFEVIKLMLQQGVDINDNYFFSGWTALHVAVMENNSEMVKLLVRHGCDVNIPDVFGSIPLIYVFDRGMVQCPKLISALMPTNVNWTDLCYPFGTMKLRSVFAMGSKETLQLFLQSYQVDLSARDKNDMTPLHYLASNSNDGIFDLFQHLDFDINAYDKMWKKTPLHIATIQGNVEGVKFLLAKGANVNATDHCGYTPLFHAISRRNSREAYYKKCVEHLAQYGANLQVVTSDAHSIFSRASRYQNYFLVEPLLAHLAIDEVAGEPIKILISDHINSDICLKKYYDLCKRELMKMKTKTVFGTVTLWKFLIDNENKVALYTRRQEPFNKIMNAKFISNKYYISLLQKRFAKTMKMDELRTKAILVLQEAISQLKYNHIIFNRIIGFLNYTDLLKFT